MVQTLNKILIVLIVLIVLSVVLAVKVTDAQHEYKKELLQKIKECNDDLNKND